MCSTATRSPMVMASTWSWVTYKVATPTRRWMREISERICTRILASRLDSGSSIKNTDGSRTTARPMATLWRWPPESWPGLRSRYSVRPNSWAVSATLARTWSLGILRRRRAKPMFSATVMCGYRA